MAGFDTSKIYDTEMPPLAGVSAVGNDNAPAAHFGSGIILGVTREQGKGPQVWIRMDDGGDGFESFSWLEIPGEQQEEKFVSLSKAKYRAILEALDKGDGTTWLPADWLNANGTRLSMLPNRRVHYGFVPRNSDGGKYDEFQFLSPEKARLNRQQGLVPSRTAYSKTRADGAAASAAAGVVAPPTVAAPPPTASTAPPPAVAPPPAAVAPPPAAVAPPAVAPPPAAVAAPPTAVAPPVSAYPPGMTAFAPPPA